LPSSPNNGTISRSGVFTLAVTAGI
jgi:hypothetical protein